MSFTDVIDTTLYFNSSLVPWTGMPTNVDYIFNIDFFNPSNTNEEYNRLHVVHIFEQPYGQDYYFDFRMYYRPYDPDENEILVYSSHNGGWVDSKYRMIRVSGGDTTNTNLILFVSDNAIEILPQRYYIYPTLTDVTRDSGNVTFLEQYSSASLLFYADSGYLLPETVTVTGVENYIWVNDVNETHTTGRLELYNPYDTITITIVGERIQTFTITANTTGLRYIGETIITQYNTATGTLYPETGYFLPETISVNGDCEYTYDNETGEITISNAHSAIIINATGEDIDTSHLTLILYNSTSEKNRLDKTLYLTAVGTLYGTLREECDVTAPIITIRYDTIPRFNYVYIPNFYRYYYVTEVRSIRNKLWEITLTRDVLMSYRTEIGNLSAIIARQENDYNALIADGELPRLCSFTKSVILPSVSNPFNTTSTVGRYILTSYTNTQGYISSSHYRKSFTSNTKMLLDTTNIEQLLRDMNAGSALLNIGSLFVNNPLEGILSLRAYPIPLETYWNITSGYNSNVLIGGWSGTTAKCAVVSSTCDNRPYYSPATFSVRENREWKLFSARYYLFLPFIGYTEIDPEYLYNKDLYIQYIIDFDTGDCIVEISSGASGFWNDSDVIKIENGKIGVDIPIGSTNLNELMSQSILKSAGMALTAFAGLSTANEIIATGGARNVVKGKVNRTLTNTLKGMNDIAGDGVPKMHVAYKGIPTSPSTMEYLALTPFIVKEAPDYYTPTNYPHTHGFPSMKTATLNTLAGFTKVESVHVEGLSTATDSEIEEVENLLLDGIII